MAVSLPYDMRFAITKVPNTGAVTWAAGLEEASATILHIGFGWCCDHVEAIGGTNRSGAQRATEATQSYCRPSG
jgi:hypothetical protein